MRKKTGQSVDVASVKEAWNAFFQQEEALTKEDLNKQGWRDTGDILSAGLSNWALRSAVKEGRLENKKFCIKVGIGKRDVNFYRPKI
jgi:hypothetical protein